MRVVNQPSSAAQQARVMSGGLAAPYSEEAEEATLGAILINPDAFWVVAAFLKHDDFYFLRHQYIWQAIERLSIKFEPIDYLTLLQQLRELGWLEEIGGAPYITRLINNTPTSINAEFYGRIVKRTAIRRRLLVAADEIKALAVNETLELETVIVQAEQRLSQVTAQALERSDQSAIEAANDLIDDLEQRMGTNETGYIPTGYGAVDKEIEVLKRGSVTTLGARPNMGKSAWATGAMVNSSRKGCKWYYISTEMETRKLMQRITAAETGINSLKIQKAQLSQDEWSKVVEATGRISKLPFHVDYRPAINMSELRALVYRKYSEVKLDVVVIDGLWQMTLPGETDRQVINSRISAELAILAKELNIAILLVHQLNRAPDQRADHRPLMSDLEYAGAIEQNSDFVIFIYRDVMYNPNTEFPNQSELIVSKNKDGIRGTIDQYFDHTITKFMDPVYRKIDLGGLMDEKEVF
jgi:replicative DNA helicase